MRIQCGDSRSVRSTVRCSRSWLAGLTSRLREGHCSSVVSSGGGRGWARGWAGRHSPQGNESEKISSGCRQEERDEHDVPRTEGHEVPLGAVGVGAEGAGVHRQRDPLGVPDGACHERHDVSEPAGDPPRTDRDRRALLAPGAPAG